MSLLIISRILVLFMFCSISITMLLPSASPLSFNFPSFSPADYNTSLLPQGDVSMTGSGALSLTLTTIDITNITNSFGRVAYKDKLLLWDPKTRTLTNFSTHFTFSIDIVGMVPGDGLTFFLLSNFSFIPDDKQGGSLGLYTPMSKSSNLSGYSYAAVEFDTYYNSKWDEYQPELHAGININSFVSEPNIRLNSSFLDGTVDVSVAYDSTTKIFSVSLSYSNQWAKLWRVVDLRDILPAMVDIGFSAATGSVFETSDIKILSWNFTSDLEIEQPVAPAKSPRGPAEVPTESPASPIIGMKNSTNKSKTGLIAGLLVGVGAVVVVSGGVIWFVIRRKMASKRATQDELDEHESIDDDFEKDTGPKRFTFNQLVDATDYFSPDRKLGEGGFGEVYRGRLDDEEVAIKKVSAGSKQGKKEYVSEVRIISRLRHRNLVQLVGWCHRKGDFLLVYKLMPNGSLDTHLYNQERHLSWPVRYKIVLGLASALVYLHEEWEQCVVHRDIKPSNVMLDSEFEAKLGDFGLARLVDHEIGSQTTVLAGTMGYLAPESVMTGGRARKESDVYSFGIVALEIACGRKPVEYGKENLVKWVWELYGRGTILEAVDNRLEMNFDEKEIQQLMVVGLWCAHPDHNLRPSILQAISVLKFESPLPNLPPTMPVSTFFVPPMNIQYTSFPEGSTGTNFTSSSFTMNSTSTGYTTNSSNLSLPSASPSASLLKTHYAELS